MITSVSGDTNNSFLPSMPVIGYITRLLVQAPRFLVWHSDFGCLSHHTRTGHVPRLPRYLQLPLTWPQIDKFVFLSVNLSINRSIHLSIHLSIYLDGLYMYKFPLFIGSIYAIHPSAHVEVHQLQPLRRQPKESDRVMSITTLLLYIYIYIHVTIVLRMFYDNLCVFCMCKFIWLVVYTY